MPAKQIPVTQFKAQCLSLLEQVSKSGQPLVITKRGKPLGASHQGCGRRGAR